MCGCLKYYYDLQGHSILTARKSYNLIPKEGYLPDDTYFNFHGIGVYFEFENGAIDVDFGPNDKCDGFDFYRLKNFLESTKKDVYPSLNNEETLRNEFDYILKSGLIIKPDWDVTRNLFCLA